MASAALAPKVAPPALTRLKIRGFVVDSACGRPLPGVVVSLMGETGENKTQPLGLLVSDNAGYVSFSLNGIPPSGHFQHLWVSPFQDGSSKVECASSSPNGLNFVLGVNSRLADEGNLQFGIQSVQDPEVLDWEVSPYSFCTRVRLQLGEGGCERLLQSPTVERELRFQRVVRTSIPANGQVNPVPEVRAVSALGDITSQTEFGALTFGEVLEFRQTWFPKGHSLGQIVYSLALAPCESLDLAVIEWSRMDTAVRQDTVTVTEQLLHEQRRDRGIEETVNAALHESQGGWSLLGGGSGASVDSGSDLLGAIGVGASQSWGDRNVWADSLQQVHDRVTQATSAYRSLNSTVIVQSSQRESNLLQTRTVTNHNHCHALTVEYYEVLRNFRVVTEFVKKRPAVLVPYLVFPFSWETALRFRTIIETVLLDKNLVDCFDAIVRVHLCPDIYTLTLTASGTSPSSATPSPEKKGMFNVFNNQVDTGINISKDDKVQIIATGAVDYSPGIGGNIGKLGPDGSPDIAPPGFPATNLRKYSLIYKIGSSDWAQGGPNVTLPDGHDAGILVLSPNDDALPGSQDGKAGWYVDVWVTAKNGSSNAGGGTGTSTGPNKVEDCCCEQRLLNHLNGNLGFYNRAIWLLQDPVERRVLLDRALGMYPKIRDGLEDRPVAVDGNYVAYIWNDPDPPEEPEVAPPQPQISILSLPTRGVFAEAELGSCNSCEVRDVTRFWQWDQSPCEQPPQISGVTPGPKGQPEPIPQPASLPSPVVQISQPLAAPDPVGLAAAMKVLGTPNIFRDMSGMAEVSKLVDGLASGAVTLAQAQGMAKKAKQQLSGDGSGSLLGGNGSAARPQSASDLSDKLQVIRNAKDLLSDPATQGPTSQYFNSDTGPGITLAGFSQDVGHTAAHFLRWLALNQDSRNGKPDLHVDQTPPHFADIMDLTLAQQAVAALKFQVHAVKFTTPLDITGLAALFDKFDTLIDPAVAACEKLTSTGSLTMNDEFRFRVPIPRSVQVALAVVLGSAGFPIGAFGQRRFDVRVVRRDSTANEFSFTVQTLEDHVYGGRRAWRVKPTGQTISGIKEYELETTEINSFSWLPDYMSETATAGEPPRLTWERFLALYVTAAGGTVTDGTRALGLTTNVNGLNRDDSLQQLAANTEMQRVLGEYPGISAEFDRLLAAANISV